MMVTVPPNFSGGMRIKVNLPTNDGEIDIVIPPGLTEGMQFEVETAQAAAEPVPLHTASVPRKVANTPLHKAAWKGDEAMVSKLIHLGADVHAINKSGSTPLHSALYFDTWTYSLMPTTFPTSIWVSPKKFKRAEAKFRIAALLLEKGCDGDAKNKFGLTPLDIAPKPGPLAICGLLKPIKWLVERDGARWDPTQTYPNDSRMPLFGAAWCGKNWNVGRAVSQPVLEGKVETIKWLIRQGCSPDHRDKAGVSSRNVCDASYWMKAKEYRRVKEYEPPIWLQLKLAMDAP